MCIDIYGSETLYKSFFGKTDVWGKKCHLFHTPLKLELTHRMKKKIEIKIALCICVIWKPAAVHTCVCCQFENVIYLMCRPAGGAQIYHQGNGTTASDWVAGAVCNCHFRYHWARVLLRCFAQNVL